MKIRELTAEHIGMVLTIETPDGVQITGKLTAVNTATQWIEEKNWGQSEPDLVPGRVTTDLAIGRWSTIDLDPNTTATIEKSL